MALIYKTVQLELLDEMNLQMPYRSQTHQGTYQIVMLSHLKHFYNLGHRSIVRIKIIGIFFFIIGIRVMFHVCNP